jgi:hypothetical protein
MESTDGQSNLDIIYRKVYILLREKQTSARSVPERSMDNSTATPLQGYFLLVTQLELVTPTTVDGTLYGIAFTLFCLYVHSLAPRLQDEDRKRQAKFMLGYSSIIMLCGLYVLIVNVWLVQDAYIKHGNYPEGPYAYTLTTYHKPLVIISTICQFALDTLTSAIQVQFVSFSSYPTTG